MKNHGDLARDVAKYIKAHERGGIGDAELVLHTLDFLNRAITLGDLEPGMDKVLPHLGQALNTAAAAFELADKKRRDDYQAELDAEKRSAADELTLESPREPNPERDQEIMNDIYAKKDAGTLTSDDIDKAREEIVSSILRADLDDIMPNAMNESKGWGYDAGDIII